jgi:hypothetical protein
MTVYRERFYGNGQLAEQWSDDGYIAVDQFGRLIEQRPLNDEELAAIQLPTTRMKQAIQSNDTYLALVDPTAAEVKTQVNRLTKQVTFLLRLQLREAEGQPIDTS